MGMINIKGLKKEDILATLYNHAKPKGLGFLHATGENIDSNIAKKYLKQYSGCFDYLNGRVLKITFFENKDEINTSLYNRDNGANLAEKLIEELRKK